MNGNTLPASNSSQKISGSIDMLYQAWSLYKQNWRSFIKLTLLLLVGFAIIGLVDLVIFLVTPPAQGVAPINFSPVQMVFIMLSFIIFFILFVLAQLSILHLIKNILCQNAVNLKDTIFQAAKNIHRYLWLVLIINIIIVAGFLLFIIPSIILAVIFSFAVYILVFEEIKGVAAIKRCWQLVKGFWFTVFSRWIVLALITAILFNALMYIIFVVGYAPVFLFLSIFLSFLSVTKIISVIFIILIFLMGAAIILSIQAVVMPIFSFSIYTMYSELWHIKSENQMATGNMSTKKKIGLSLILIAPLLFVISMALASYTIEKTVFKNKGIPLSPFSSTKSTTSPSSFSSPSTFSADMTRSSALDILETQLTLYHVDNDRYPDSLEELNTKYMSPSFYEKYAKDPTTKQLYSYTIKDMGRGYNLCAVFDNDYRSYKKGENCISNYK